MSENTIKETALTPNNEPAADLPYDELDAAEAEAAAIDNVNVYTHKFRSPFKYEGKTYDELNFDFSRLTGKDSLAIANELQLLNKYVAVPTMSLEYLLRMAVRACVEKVGADVLCALPIFDFNQITGRARAFLLRLEF